jgi:hypothetical protein
MVNLRDKVGEDRLKQISDKVKAHEMQLAIVQELYQVIVTGDIQKGEPGMLENNRNTTKALMEQAQSLGRIELRLSNYAELDKRIKEIEERHVRIDKDNETKIDEGRKYRFYFITLAISNIVTLAITVILTWFKR